MLPKKSQKTEDDVIAREFNPGNSKLTSVTDLSSRNGGFLKIEIELSPFVYEIKLWKN